MGYRVQGPVAFPWSLEHNDKHYDFARDWSTCFVQYADVRPTGICFEQKLSLFHPGDIHSARVRSLETGPLGLMITHVAELRTSSNKSKRSS